SRCAYQPFVVTDDTQWSSLQQLTNNHFTALKTEPSRDSLFPVGPGPILCDTSAPAPPGFCTAAAYLFSFGPHRVPRRLTRPPRARHRAPAYRYHFGAL